MRGTKDRIFICTAGGPRLGQLIPIELRLSGLTLVANAEVVGLRRESKLFKLGVWVRFPDEEIERLRKLIGLSPAEAPKAGRRTRRLPCTLSVEVTRPPLPNPAFARDLSESGCQLDTLATRTALSGDPPGQPGQHRVEERDRRAVA